MTREKPAIIDGAERDGPLSLRATTELGCAQFNMADGSQELCQ